MISDLPRDLAENVLIRLPMTSMRAVRSVCKEWNTLSKDSFFTKKHIAQAKAAAAEEFKVVMVMDSRVYLMGINFYEDVDPTINHHGKLISLDDSSRVDVSLVYHCDGLLLCITKDFTKLVVWNPYLCQTLWLEPISTSLYSSYRYAIGYKNSKSCRSYKILRLLSMCFMYEVYDLNSNSWSFFDVHPYWYIQCYARGVSLKGNTYWFARELYRYQEMADFLICFDFTTERFGPRLRLPFGHPASEDTVSLSSVRDEQLAVLFQTCADNKQMEIWVTVKIEPEVVSWNKVFLRVDMQPLTRFQFRVKAGSFFIDEEKKLVVVFDRDNKKVKNTPRRNTAYIIGEGGYFRKVDLGREASEIHDFPGKISPLGCSYVPSSVQIKQRN
ncbi:PREDICTED: putative F-box protein At3g17620 [Camelina sativa]|uniref:F-box protein At3g17620 n=1 Tax=Camelina sativa TaxID=90675 RepID=A0ABM0WAT3_CAMSA|nr:PREDICTED: putative F-box protein At3g17620 [Camelina sativa]